MSKNNRSNSNTNQHITPFVDWCYGCTEVLFNISLFVVHKLVLHGKQFLAKGNSIKHRQIWEGNGVEDGYLCAIHSLIIR